jgi:hypothetical protein
MPLVILGVIAVIFAALLIFDTFGMKGKKNRARGVFPAETERKPYETSSDGKVIFLFGGSQKAAEIESPYADPDADEDADRDEYADPQDGDAHADGNADEREREDSDE